jgi:hypothetical protein
MRMGVSGELVLPSGVVGGGGSMVVGLGDGVTVGKFPGDGGTAGVPGGMVGQ